MKIIKKLVLLICVLAALVILLDLYVVHAGSTLMCEEGAYTDECSRVLEDADCIMVLGAGVYADNTPTPMLKDRLDRGIELYKAGAAPKLLLSGDNGQTEYNEVEVMREYAVDNGVKESDIYLDHAGFSTYESMYRARDVFAVKKMIVVTQKYHEYRALYIADHLGLDVVGVCAEDIDYYGDSYRECREILARSKDSIKCVFKPKPTYLGDVIDIHGDGRDSWS